MWLLSWRRRKACLSRPNKWWQPKPWIVLATSSRKKVSHLRRLSAQDGNCAPISCTKLMVSPKPQRRIFLDSSVLYAAAFSATGPARRLILKGLEGSVTLAISDLVLEETKRNLTKNAPVALPSFTILADLFLPVITNPTKAEVIRAAQIVHL